MTTHVGRPIVIAVDREYPVGGVHVPPSGDRRRDVGDVDGPRVGLLIVEDLELVVVGMAVKLETDSFGKFFLKKKSSKIKVFLIGHKKWNLKQKYEPKSLSIESCPCATMVPSNRSTSLANSRPQGP